MINENCCIYYFNSTISIVIVTLYIFNKKVCDLFFLHNILKSCNEGLQTFILLKRVCLTLVFRSVIFEKN